MFGEYGWRDDKDDMGLEGRSKGDADGEEGYWWPAECTEGREFARGAMGGASAEACDLERRWGLV